MAENTANAGEFELSGQAVSPVRPRAAVVERSGRSKRSASAWREGRALDERDTEASAPAARERGHGRAVVARRVATGQRLRLSGIGEVERWRTVVGVVDDVPMGNPLSRSRSSVAIYVPLRQTAARSAAVIYRHRGSPISGQSAFHRALSDADPLIAPSNVASLEEVVAKTTLIAKSVAALFGACFGFALLLASSGTYGLMARSIGRRTRELGIRRALGATDRTILRMLLVQGVRQLGVGAAYALPLTLLVGWGFSRYLPIELGTAAAAALAVWLAVTAIVLVATWLPTRKAVGVELRDALWRE
jgi:hypothetical protein